MVEKEGRSIDTGIPQPTDRELLARLHSRDTAAFALLYDRHAPMAFGAAIRLLGDPSTAEAAVEAIFLALWRGTPDIEAAHPPVRSWLLAQRIRSARRPGSPSRPHYSEPNAASLTGNDMGDAPGLDLSPA